MWRNNKLETLSIRVSGRSPGGAVPGPSADHHTVHHTRAVHDIERWVGGLPPGALAITGVLASVLARRLKAIGKETGERNHGDNA